VQAPSTLVAVGFGVLGWWASSSRCFSWSDSGPSAAFRRGWPCSV